MPFKIYLILTHILKIREIYSCLNKIKIFLLAYERKTKSTVTF